MSIKPKVLGLIELVQKGQMLEAMTTYYADNVAMQENVSAPTVGFASNYAREELFYGSLRSAKFRLVSVVVEQQLFGVSTQRQCACLIASILSTRCVNGEPS